MNQEREAVARIIDPAAWRGWDSCGAYPLRTDDSLTKADAILALRSGGEGWRPISTLPGDDTMVLAGCPDGRIMVWRGSILARNLRGPTPQHLQFPATGWMPLPASPSTHGEG